MKTMRISATLFLGMLVLAALPARAGEYTFDRDITLVIAFAPGASIDSFGQKFKQVGEKYLNGKSMLIEYKPGGSTSIGMNYMLARPRDGYTIILNGNSTEFGVATGQAEGYDENDYIGLCNLASEQAVVFTHIDSPFNSFDEVVDFARKNPGRLNWGGGSTMSQNHFFALQVMAAGDIEFNYIPYENGGEVTVAVLGKNLDVGCISTGAIMPYVRDGRVKILAQGLNRRADALPDIPTAYETPGMDYEKFGFPYWSTRSIDAPEGCPEEVLQAWDRLILQINADPDWKEFLKSKGVLEGSFMTRPDVTKYIRQTTGNLRALYETMF